MKLSQVYRIIFFIVSWNYLFISKTDSTSLNHHKIRHEKLEEILKPLVNLENLSNESDEILSNEILSQEEEINKNRLKRTNYETLKRINILKTNKIVPLRNKKTYSTVPTYLKLTHESLISSVMNSMLQSESFSRNGQQRNQGSNFRTPLLRALVPSEITHGDLGMTLIKFNISRSQIGIFNSAQIIFTRNNDEVELHDGSHICVNLEYGTNQAKQSQLIVDGIKFYSFDFTDFLKNNLNLDLASSTKENNHIILLDALVFKNNRRKQVSVEALFDLENDSPFIFLQYVNTLLPTPEALSKSLSTSSDEEEQEESQHTHTRVKRLSGQGNFPSVNELLNNQNHAKKIEVNHHRSLNSPSPNICKYHEWIVKPLDVGLDDVLEPQYLDLGYCAGECPFPLENDVFNFTLHSFLIDRNRLIKGFNTVYNLPEPKCVPVSYKPLMVLVGDLEENIYTTIQYQDGSVASCGCR